MALEFPSSPTIGDTYSGFQWDGTKWIRINTDVGISYEAGTWVPFITGGTTDPTMTYTNQSGAYYKVGNWVTARFRVSWSVRSGGTGNAQISLPYVVGPESGGGAVVGPMVCAGVSMPSGGLWIQGYTFNTLDHLRLVASKSGIAFSYVQVTDLTVAEGAIDASITYATV